MRPLTVCIRHSAHCRQTGTNVRTNVPSAEREWQANFALFI
jgi:hypothetical protein